MTLDEMVAQLSERSLVSLGRSFAHPIWPNPALEQDVNQFLYHYSFLKQDAGYVKFLECYAGAFVFDHTSDSTLDILGFSIASSHIIDYPGEIINEEGFLVFCVSLVNFYENEKRQEVEISYAFDATGTRQWGIYAKTLAITRIQDVNPRYMFYCNTFTDWLQRVIDKNVFAPLNLK